MKGALFGTIAAAVAAAWLAPSQATAISSCGSGTHGSQGYGYAGFESAGVGSGVRATITQLRAPRVEAGHAAAWVGVGGPSAGPRGDSMWLQVGIALLPRTPAMIYAEITRPGHETVFLPLVRDVAVGTRHRLAVIEVSGRPGVWRVWVDGRPATDPVMLQGSHKRWKPIATAETWNGGSATCNGFSFRFERVGVALAPGGSWRAFAPGFSFRDRGYVVRQLRPVRGGSRTLATHAIQAFAFDAASA